jgi:hypothetical protein
MVHVQLMARSSVSLPKLAVIGLVLALAGCAQRAQPIYQEPEPAPPVPEEMVVLCPSGR